jgi:predicted dinucleotide-binding enzyme
MAAAVQAELPQALVAAAGHHLPARELENLDAPLRSDVLVCSDQVVAIRTTMSLVATIPGLRPLDAGSLASAGAIEAFTAVLVNVNIRYKAHSSLLLTGLDHLVSPNDPSSRDASLRVGSADGLQRSSASETLGKG